MSLSPPPDQAEAELHPAFIPDEVMNEVAEEEQLLSTEDPRSSGVKGLFEDALLRPDTAAYGYTVRIVLVAILMSVVVMALETVHPLIDDFHDLFFAVDMILLGIFTLEYVGNTWVVPNRRAYLLSVWGIIDLLAIAPAYLELALGGVVGAVFLRQLRTLRVMRTLRVLKLLKVAADRAAASAAQASQRKNTFLVDIQIYGICLFAVVSISSSLIFLAEGVGPTVPELTSEALTALKESIDGKGEKPDYVGDAMLAVYAERAEKGWSTPVYTFTSVPKSYWWSIVTLTTTGYGDMFPVTGAGRVIAGVTMLAGLALFSLLTSVVGRALMTSLFGREDEGSTKTKQTIIVLGSRLPLGLRPVEVVTRARTPVAPVDNDPTSQIGILEGPLMGGGINLKAIGESASRLSREVVSATTDDADGDARGLTIDAQSNWWDKFVHQSFIDHESALYQPIHRLLTGLIFFSVLIVVLDSVQSIHEEYKSVFEAAEFIIVGIFTVEFLAHYRMAGSKWGYVFSLWGMVDLLAVLPTYVTLGITLLQLIGVPLTIGTGLLFKVMRMLRVLRMLRTLKLAKTATSNMQQTMSGSGSSFWTDLQIYLIALFTVLVISSTLMWNVEFDPLDEKSTTMFVDIPTSMWWGIVTLCTVGYGDMFPQTLAGRIIAGVTMLAGLALFGILTSVIGRALMASLFGSSESEEEEPEVIYVDNPDDNLNPTGIDHLKALLAIGAISEAEFESMSDRVLSAD